MGDPADPKGTKLVKNIIHGVRLKTIQYTNGNIQFNPGDMRQDLSTSIQEITSDAGTNTAKTLGEIQLNTIAGTCQKFMFDYEYFEDYSTPLYLWNTNYVTTDQKRLKLKQVQQKSCDNGMAIPPYVFTYYDEKVSRRLSCGQDHWGYSNGITNNQGLLPSYTIDNYTNVALANRDSEWPAMRGGALQKITYPTGGSSEMDFEPNRTWTSYTEYNPLFLTSRAVGYDGNQNPQVFNISFAQQVHKIKIVNKPGRGSASVYTPGGNVIAQDGETKEFILHFEPGTHPITIFKSGATSSSTCEVFFYDMVPNPIQENKVVGGLRIKSITTKDGFNSTGNVTQYTYTDNAGKSTGILYSRPTYIQYIRNDLTGEVGGGGIYPNNHETPSGCIGRFQGSGGVYFVSPGSLRPMASTQGGHIGYNEVKISNTGNGYSIYRYFGSNYWDNISGDVVFRNLITESCSIQNTPNYPEAPMPYDYKRGELKFEGKFKENGEMIQSVDFYPVFEENKLVTPCVITAAVSNTWQTTFFDLKTSRKKQLTTIEHIIVPGQGSMENTTVVYYESPYHNQVTRQVNTNSKGETIEKKFKYVFDYALPCDVISDGHQQYLYDAASHLAQYKINLLSLCPNDSWCRRTLFDNYNLNMHNTRVNYVNYRRTNFTDATSQFNTGFQNSKSSANAALKPILELRDKGINVPVEVTTWKNNTLLSANFNVYDYNGVLAGMVYPSKSQKIPLLAPSVAFTASAPNGNLLTKDSRYEDEAFYNVQGGNPVEVKGKDGVSTSYIWGYNNSSPIVKAEGVNYSTLISAYNNVGGNLSMLRSQPSLSGAFISTYTYKPGVGMESETNPSGITMTYEYDPLHRLSIIKDNNGNIIKKFCYNYANEPVQCEGMVYTNTLAYSGSFARTNCLINEEGSTVIYTVPVNTVSSTISIADANLKAQQKLQNEGPAYANANGICTPLSTCIPNICQAQGLPYKCVGGNCEQGFQVFTGDVWIDGVNYCRYHYEWSDLSRSIDYFTPSGGFGCLQEAF
jgi:YD repeat-containing protein